MKYTRYDLKKNKKDNAVFVVVLFSVLILAFLIGSFISNFFMKNMSYENSNAKQGGTSTIAFDNSVNKAYKFIALQHGKFQKPENLEQARKNISDYGNPFNIQEQDGTRLILGIYNEEETAKVSKLLTDKNIDNSKISFVIQADEDLCNQEIAALINAELEVINRLSDKGIKSIQTDELKKWSSDLQQTDLKSKNASILNELKTNINSLPKDLTSEKVNEIEIYIYNTLKKISNK